MAAFYMQWICHPSRQCCLPLRFCQHRQLRDHQVCCFPLMNTTPFRFLVLHARVHATLPLLWVGIRVLFDALSRCCLALPIHYFLEMTPKRSRTDGIGGKGLLDMLCARSQHQKAPPVF